MRRALKDGTSTAVSVLRKRRHRGHDRGGERGDAGHHRGGRADPKLGYVPEGGSTKRCAKCAVDISVPWIICGICQLHVEERWMIWQHLRRDQALYDFRQLKKRQTKLIT